MKPQIHLLALALLFPITSHAADVAAQTRAHYAAVERAIPKASVVKRDLQGYSGEGGELTAYFQNGAPVKMIARHYFNTFRLTDELYFWQGRLFFVLETRESYDNPISAPKLKIVSRTQNRFYFKNGKLWRWIAEDGEGIDGGSEFDTHEKEQLDFAREMLKGTRGKAKSIQKR